VIKYSEVQFIIGAIFLTLFITVGIIYYIHVKNLCDPEKEARNKCLEFIKEPNTIKLIELDKEYPAYKTNLIDSRLEFTDSSIIDTIRTMINDIKTGTWNKPNHAWDAKMKITLVNNESFEFNISKVNNDPNKGMTNIYFGSKHCEDALPGYSLTLGKYLEKITKYSGENY
jgi:hypothetical protein